MAEVNTGGDGGGGRHKKKRAKKLSTRIDMTPMVDLGFLLLTFFMLTTTFSKPKVIELTPPVKNIQKQDSTHVQDSLAITVVLSGNHKVYYYMGVLDTAKNNIRLTTFAEKGGIRDTIFRHNSFVRRNLAPIEAKHNNKQMADTTYNRLKEKVQGDKMALFVIIKTDSAAKYVDVVNMLDEMNICDVDKYSLIDAQKSEIEMIRRYNEEHNIK